MLWDYFSDGSISTSTAVNKLIDRLVDMIPGVEAAALAKSLGYKLKTISNSIGGDFFWWDMGSIIVDLGNFILDFTPYATLSDVVAGLWNLTALL